MYVQFLAIIDLFLFNMYSEPFSIHHSTLLNIQVLIILNHFLAIALNIFSLAMSEF